MVAKFARELALDFADQIAISIRQGVEPLHDDAIGLRIERPEREILELLAHLLHAHAAGQGRIDIERFLGNTSARGLGYEFERPHVMQAIGELNQEHTHVVGNRQQQLAQILGLLGLARDEFEPLQLGESLDQGADLGSEEAVDLGAGRLGVLDRVVQQRRDDGGVVELEVGQNGRHLERMGKIRVARGAGLRPVCLHRIDIGAVEQILVRIGVIGADPFHQVVLPHHARTRLLRPRPLSRRRRRQRG